MRVGRHHVRTSPWGIGFDIDCSSALSSRSAQLALGVVAMHGQVGIPLHADTGKACTYTGLPGLSASDASWAEVS
jgi:hypothetical protein